MKDKKSLVIIFFFIVIVVYIFRSIFLQGLLPIPADTIIGLYHPFRDLYAKEYPNGIPFKNFLVTDPVRQQYPWRDLAVNVEKNLELPLWNPYQFAGTPLLGNFQTAAFYPLNFFFFILPFSTAWVLLLILQPILAGIFLYWYLRFWKINYPASFLGAFVFAFCGFSIAWLEWNTIIHVGLWLPFILLAIDKMFSPIQEKKLFIWSIVYTISLIFSFFAGHLQTFFYLYLVSILYFFVRWIQLGKNRNKFIVFTILNTIFFVVTSIQWIPTLQVIIESARDVDQANWQKIGWFIPWEHAIQFLAPDFFGNPTTLNYWGVWNYAEFVGYIGVFPLGLALFALFYRRDKKTLFFGSLLFIALLFAFPTAIAKIPFLLQIPFLSTAQPTRLLFIIDFSLAVLSGFGLDFFLKKKQSIIPFVSICILYLFLWIFIITGSYHNSISPENSIISKRNLFLPTGLSMVIVLSVFFITFFKNTRFKMVFLGVLFLITIFDLSRFADKFLPFTTQAYLFPYTKALDFLQYQDDKNFRIMAVDSRILPPNFSTVYRLQSIDGYDPLYLRRYGELIAASERGNPTIAPPFGFNRIITPHNYESRIIDLLGVKYILSLTEIQSPKLTKVFQEGETRIYQNKDAFPRVFFVENVHQVTSKEKAIEKLFDSTIDLKKIAVVEVTNRLPLVFPKPTPSNVFESKTVIDTYSENKIIIKTEANRDAVLVLSDSYYPTWHAKIDGKETVIYRTNFHFRSVIVPEGKHTIEFYNRLF